MSSQAATETPFGQALRQMNKMVDQFQKGYFGFCPAESWSPSVNVYENDTGFVVCVDLAGVAKEKIDLQVIGGALRLKGSRPVPAHPDVPESPQGKWRVHLMEIDNGSFCRLVELPHDVDPDKVEAAYRDGLLWVSLPKRQ